MKTLGSHTGYLQIDHRESPGLTEADVAAMPGAMAVPEGTQLERDVKQCSHCQRGVVLNPGRVRDRAYCAHCHHYICDACAAIYKTSGVCVPFQARLDAAETIAVKFAGQPDHPAADPDIVLTDAWRLPPRTSVPSSAT